MEPDPMMEPIGAGPSVEYVRTLDHPQFEPIGIDADGELIPPPKKAPVDRPWNRTKWTKIKSKRKAAAKSRARNR